MNYLKLDEYKSKDNKLNKKKIAITAGFFTLVIAIIVMVSIYITNEDFRKKIDKYIFRKEIQENTAATITVNTEEDPYIYAYDKYINILSKNTLKTYSSSGKKEFETEIKISKPIFDSNNRYLAIAENKGQKLYLVSGSNIIWQTDIEGSIANVNVNKNGYVTIVVEDTTYKNVIIVYQPDGKELFKFYLSSTVAMDVDISNDNKYLAIAEINTSGAVLQSNIKIVSMEKAQTNPDDPVDYVYSANTKDIILNIKYQDHNRLICMYDGSIHAVQDNKDEEILSLADKTISFADIELKNAIVRITEQSAGLFKATSAVSLINANTKKENVYHIDGVIKELYASGEVIAANLGSEVYFISTNGWLIKKYTSSQEIKNIILCDNLAGIVYRDKIELIHL